MEWICDVVVVVVVWLDEKRMQVVVVVEVLGLQDYCGIQVQVQVLCCVCSQLVEQLVLVLVLYFRVRFFFQLRKMCFEVSI